MSTPREPAVYPDMPQCLQAILHDIQREGPQPPVGIRGLPPSWSDPTRLGDLAAALALIRTARHHYRRRLVAQKAEADHVRPQAIRRAVQLLGHPYVRL